jgi:hypothetical protein
MVNSKDFNQDYNSYYRPTPERNDPDFFPKQGTLPLYFFKNDILQNEEPITTAQLIEEPNYNIHHETNNYIIPIIVLGFIIVFAFVCYNCCKQKKYVKNYNKAVFNSVKRPRTTPYYTFEDTIILHC